MYCDDIPTMLGRLEQRIPQKMIISHFSRRMPRGPYLQPTRSREDHQDRNDRSSEDSWRLDLYRRKGHPTERLHASWNPVYGRAEFRRRRGKPTFGRVLRFCSRESFQVHTTGQVIGAVVAEDILIARRAASLVKVHYEDLPAILTCEVSRRLPDAMPDARFVFSAQEAIAANSMYPQEFHYKRGQPPAAIFPECHVVLKGDVPMGFQEHFYMEPNNCLVIPKVRRHYLPKSS